MSVLVRTVQLVSVLDCFEIVLGIVYIQELQHLLLQNNTETEGWKSIGKKLCAGYM